MAKRQLGRLKCPQCDREFAMPAHLARHVNSAHNPGGNAKPKAGASKLKTQKGRGILTTSAVGGPDPGILLSQMQTYHGQLLAQRAEVEKQILAIESAITAFGAAPSSARNLPGAKRGRRRAGTPTLKDFIARVLQTRGKPMAVKDIAAGVKQAGFQTANKTLARSVGTMLARMSNVRKVDRGIFALK